jgi:hypothetical protein
MTPREVGGLQAIAKAHGGSLTINPHTGLAEAGFLKNILPTLAGAALTVGTGGVINPLTAGLLVGGGVGLAKGDLKAGLMAGLGAYGGAGIGGGLMSAGTASAQNAAAAGVENAAANEVAAQTATQTANNAAMQAAGEQTAAESARLAGQNALAGQTGQAAAEAAANQAALETAKTNAMAEASKTAVANPFTTAGNGITSLGNEAGRNAFTNYAAGSGGSATQYGLAAAGPAIADAAKVKPPEEEKYDGPLSKYEFDPERYRAQEVAPPQPYYRAQMYNYATGGPIEQMSNANSVGMNTGYPGADVNQGAYATPYQTPISRNVVTGSADVGVNPMNGEMNFAAGGHLGGYSDGGRMLKGPGDGMSDSIPAKIGAKQPARLADGEFVVPADVVSHLGNGSSDAGAKQLYKMMDRIRAARTGKKRQAPQVKATKAMPA